MKKRIIFILILALSLVWVAGCAKSDTSKTTTTQATEHASQPEKSESAAQTGESKTVQTTERVTETTPAASASESTAAPSESQKAEQKDVNVLALKGPTAMGMVQFMNAAEKGEIEGFKYHFSISPAIDEVAPKLIKGEVDIAAVPANMSSVLYNNTEGKVRVLAINTLGVLYIAESGDSIQSVEDLRGKTIFAAGKGATPEYALTYILKENGLDPEKDVTIEWKSEHAECVAALNAGENAIALLPQPFLTTAQMKNDKIRVALDLNAEWNNLQKNAEKPSGLITGVVIARTEFVEQNPEAVKDFLKNYETSIKFVRENNEEAAKLVGAYEIVPEPVAVKALPACNITFIAGDEMQSALAGYLSVLHAQNPKAVGGKLPDDAFYYKSTK